MRFQLTGLMLLALAPCLRAQVANQRNDASVVVPADGGIVPRFAFPLFHFGCSAGAKPKYFQFLFKVPEGGPGAVRSMAFRRWDTANAPSVYPPITIDVEIWAGHSPVTPARLSADLPANRGPDFSLVASRRRISFPSTPKGVNGRYPFDYRMPFDAPVSFQPGRTGIIEWRLFGSTLCTGGSRINAGIELYAAYREMGTPFGAACSRWGDGGNELWVRQISAGNSSMAMMIPPSVTGGTSYSRVFGGLRKDSWAGLRLPYSLDAWGALGCSLYISYDWEWPKMASWSDDGFTFASLELPNDPGLVGQTLYAQGVRFDPIANALGIATSQAWSMPVGPHLDAPISFLQAPFGYNGLDGGQPFVGVGPVIQLSDR